MRQFAKRSSMLLLLSTAMSPVWTPPSESAEVIGTDADRNKAAINRIGVSLAGAEFGTDRPEFSNSNPGQLSIDYTYNSERTVQYFCENGLTLIRVPLRWERLQPVLGEELAEKELTLVKNFISWVRKHGGRVILDVHNYGRYTLVTQGQRQELIIDQRVGDSVPVSREHFQDLWRRLSKEFAGEDAVAAYGLMNEPHDMGHSDWKVISQGAVTAIRAEGDSKLILVSGDGWSNAHRFEEVNGKLAWIRDPVANIAYEAHCYFDSDHTGQYSRSYDAELTDDPNLAKRSVERLMPFVRWCSTNKVRGFIGEFAIPRDDARWQELLATFLEILSEADMGGCYWAGGEWWGDYALSIQPTNGAQTHAPQMKLLRRTD